MGRTTNPGLAAARRDFQRVALKYARLEVACEDFDSPNEARQQRLEHECEAARVEFQGAYRALRTWGKP